MTHRGRMLVSHFLANDLKQDWRYGAATFEERLLDNDLNSNWGGWQRTACLTLGRTPNLNITVQSRKYDSSGTFIKKWVPELKNVSMDWIHEPWNMDEKRQKMYKVAISKGVEDMKGKEDYVTYPYPIESAYCNLEIQKKEMEDREKTKLKRKAEK